MRAILSFFVFLLFVYWSLPAWPIDDNATVLVFFCPETDCMSLFTTTLTQARKSIHCALYDFSEELLPFFDGLRGKDIQIITKTRIKRPYLSQPQTHALSHNKFCVIDNQLVWTGSFNPTGNKNRNDVLLLSSPALAKNYETEFQEMLTRKSKQAPYSKINADTLQIENLFCLDDDCQKYVIDTLNKAKLSVYAMAYSFTDKDVASVLLQKKKEGQDIRVLLEARQIDEYSVFSSLHPFVPVRVSNQEGLLHYKVFIIDKKTVITGSANPTQNGYVHNDENILILHSPVNAQRYANRFTEEWEHATVLREKTNK